MNSYKASLLGAIILMGCSIAVANNNDDHGAPKHADQSKDANTSAEKPAKVDANNTDTAVKAVKKKKAARVSKKAAAANKDDANSHATEHDAPPAAAAPPLTAKRVMVRDRTALAKEVNVLYPVLNPVSGLPAIAASDATPQDAHAPAVPAASLVETVAHVVEAPKVEQSSYSLVDPHPAEYVRHVAEVTERADEAVRQTNIEGARTNEAIAKPVEPVRNTSEANMACTPPSKAEIAALFDRWNNSLSTGDPKKVVANYAPYSVLLPTVSNKARFTAAEKEDYFQHFLERKPVGKIDDSLIEVDCRIASDAGLYTFSFNDGSVVKARYSFAYKKIGNEWFISSHHSSGMPEKQNTSGKVAAHEKAIAKTAERNAVREEILNEIPSRSQGWVRFP